VLLVGVAWMVLGLISVSHQVDSFPRGIIGAVVVGIIRITRVRRARAQGF
jgi:hypothetical protein